MAAKARGGAPREIGDLIDRFRAGRDPEECFRRIFERYYRLVRRYFAERGMSPEECENLSQETFLAVYRGLPGFRQEVDFDTWLFAIARRIFAGEVRRLVSRREHLPEVPIERAAEGMLAPAERGADAGPLQATLDREARRRLLRALNGLPEQMRLCATLRLCYELKYREIAEELAISEDAVRVQLARARKRLRRELDAPESRSP